MKVKSILNLSTVTKIEITGANFVSHEVDYLKETINIDNYDTFIVYPAISLLPIHVLNATITNINVNTITKALSITVKENL